MATVNTKDFFFFQTMEGLKQICLISWRARKQLVHFQLLKYEILETLWNTVGKPSFNTPAFHIYVQLSQKWDTPPAVSISAHLAKYLIKITKFSKLQKSDLPFLLLLPSSEEYHMNDLRVRARGLHTYFASVVLLAFSMFFKLSGDRSWNRQLSFMFQTDSISTPTLGIPALIEKATAPAW